MKVAAIQFSMKPVAKPEDFWTRTEALLKKAAAEGAQVAVLPEYFSIPYALTMTPTGSFRQRLVGFQKHAAEFEERFQELSDSLKMLIVAGTYPFSKGGKLLNRSAAFRPKTEIIYQDKIQMTRFESEEWDVSGGPRDLQIFEWQGFECAIAICYDVEFPQMSLALAKAGVDLLLVPSCTEAYHGYWRVRHCAAARAIECQLIAVVSSCIEGDTRFSEIDAHYGQGCILSPCDGKYPERGVIAEGAVG